jgi:hypothetical protein
VSRWTDENGVSLDTPEALGAGRNLTVWMILAAFIGIISAVGAWAVLS